MRKKKYMRDRAGIRKCLAIGMTAAMCMAMLAGCSTSQSTGNGSASAGTEVTSDVSTETDADTDNENGETNAADTENTSTKTEMTVEEMQTAIDEAMSNADIDITDMFTKRDLAGTYDKSEAVKITLSGKTATCNSSNVQIEDGVVTIKAAGVYILSGTLSDGTIIVDAGDEDKVQLVLDGVSITAADYAAIYAKNADKVFVTLADGAENSLTVSGDYVQTDDNNVDAVIFAKCDLTLNGTGSLTVKNTTGHGIVSKDDLVVTGGTYTIDSQDHCLNGKDSVRIADGTFNLSCDEDGIHAGNDDQQDGYVYIEGGDINISVGDDAIHAEGLLIITGGDIDVSKSYEGVEGYKILVTGGNIDVISSDDGFNAAGGSSSGSDDNKGGFGGGPGMGGVDMDADSDAYILITGGTININADGDGLDSNGCIGITGGSVCVLGPSDNGNGAMDYGICATITGGEIIAVGGSGMAQGFGDESTQCSALVNFDEWIDAGETITLTDSDGKEVLSYKVDKKFNSVVISTSDMKQGDTYTLTVGDQSSTFTLDDITYSEGSGGMQRPGGNSDNGGMQRPGGNSDDGNMQGPGGGSDNGGMQRPGGNSDNGQNDSTNGSSQNTDNSSNSDSMSI